MKFGAITAFAAVLAALAVSADAQTQSAAQNQSQDNSAANTASSPDVNLTPRRVVFGPSDRGVKEITVFNRTNKTATYTIVLIDQAMQVSATRLSRSRGRGQSVSAPFSDPVPYR